MKKILSSVAIIAAISSFSGVANAENTGCGLGTMIFHGNDGVPANILAVTTNGTSGNQTFGISSGTLGCDQKAKVQSKAGRLFVFANENLNELALDASNGGGEYLSSAAEIIGVKDADKAHFNEVVQANFSEIFSGNSNTKTVVDSLVAVMQKDEVLKSYKI
ncbi:MAG: hypothetical protein K0R25_44 [Rickettsiaceae bacterium]|jgi:hypothetical protein|nr:hypothetical protein [Rickettsiaceae bacterium]